jgi:hypothetical protein
MVSRSFHPTFILRPRNLPPLNLHTRGYARLALAVRSLW